MNSKCFRGTSLQVIILVTCFSLVVFAASKNVFIEEPSHFSLVLSNILRKSVEQLSANEHVKKAVKSLSKELQQLEASGGHEAAKKPQVKKRKGSDDADDLTGRAHKLYDTVEAFLNEEGIKPKKKEGKRGGGELAKFFADFQLFQKELERNIVNYERLGRLLKKGFSVMSSRPQLRKNVARTINDLAIIPREVTNVANVEEILNVVSQLISYWNSAVGQKMVKPLLDNLMKHFIQSEFDVNSIKPTVDLFLAAILDTKMTKQIQPFVDGSFKIASKLIGVLKKTGHGNMLKNFNAKRLMTEAENAYLDFMIGTIDHLLEALESTGSTLQNLDTVAEVVEKYGGIPGTLDKRFKLGSYDDPANKVKSIAIHIKRAVAVSKESKVAVSEWEPYPLQHPSVAIDAVKQVIVALNEADRTLQDIWPLQGYLRTHAAVKRHEDIRIEVAQTKNRMQRAIDSTHKMEVLIEDIKNINSIFDMADILKDVRAILTGYPKLSLVVLLLDLLLDELGKTKEIAYAGY